MSHNPARWEYFVEETRNCLNQIKVLNLSLLDLHNLSVVYPFALVTRPDPAPSGSVSNRVLGLFSTEDLAEEALHVKITVPPKDDHQEFGRACRVDCHHRNISCEVPAWKEEGGAPKSFLFISHHLKNLAGRILTVLDASYVNEQQNRAVKSLVKREIRQKIDEIWKKCYTQDSEGEESSSDTDRDVLNS